MSPRKRVSATGELWSNPDLRGPRYSQSLQRGLAILGCFTPGRPVLEIVDIADDLGMSHTTTHRYVITLVALGYLERRSSRKYRLGLRVSDLRAESESRHGAGCGTLGRPVAVQLSKRQVDHVAEEAPLGGSLLWVLSGVPGLRDTFEAATRGRSRQVAKSLISGLSLLECMPVDGRYVRGAELARMLGMKGNVAGRYLYTLLGAGLLEQDGRTRRYRIATRVRRAASDSAGFQDARREITRLRIENEVLADQLDSAISRLTELGDVLSCGLVNRKLESTPASRRGFTSRRKGIRGPRPARVTPAP